MVDIVANLKNLFISPRDVSLVAVVNPDGSLVGGGGGTAGGATEATQLEVLMAISELEQDFGHAEDAAWAGTGSGTAIAVLKALYAQNTEIIALLTAIRNNTASS